MADKPRSFKTTRPRAREFNAKSHIDKLYKGEWTHYAKAFLKTNPKCLACGSPSQACDHLVPHKGDIQIFWNRENHIPLCHSCHNTLTSRFDKKYPQDTKGKLRWIHMMRDKHEIEGSLRVKVTPFNIPLVSIDQDPLGLNNEPTEPPKGRDAVLAYLDKKVKP